MPQELLCLFCVRYFAVPAWKGESWKSDRTMARQSLPSRAIDREPQKAYRGSMVSAEGIEPSTSSLKSIGHRIFTRH